MKNRFNAPYFILQVIFWPFCFAIWMLYQNAPGSLSGTTLFPYMYFYMGAQFLKGLHRMLVCDAQGCLFNPFSRSQCLTLALLATNATLLHLSAGASGLMDEQLLLTLINLIMWGAVSHQIYYTLQEFTTILDIYTFSIKHPDKLKP